MDGPQETRREHEGFISLHDHLTSELRALRELLNARADAQEKALGVALDALNLRLAGMNEFRDTLRDQAARLATREQLDGVVARMDSELKSLQLSRAELQGKADLRSVWVGIGLSLIAIGIALAGLWLKARGG